VIPQPSHVHLPDSIFGKSAMFFPGHIIMNDLRLRTIKIKCKSFCNDVFNKYVNGESTGNKNNKSGFPNNFVINNTQVGDRQEIVEAFNIFFFPK
jgi:hypothetical protein